MSGPRGEGGVLRVVLGGGGGAYGRSQGGAGGRIDTDLLIDSTGTDNLPGLLARRGRVRRFITPAFPSSRDKDFPCRFTRAGTPLSSEYGRWKTVKARLWPWLSGEIHSNVSSCSLCARKRKRWFIPEVRVERERPLSRP